MAPRRRDEIEDVLEDRQHVWLAEQLDEVDTAMCEQFDALNVTIADHNAASTKKLNRIAYVGATATVALLTLVIDTLLPAFTSTVLPW